MGRAPNSGAPQRVSNAHVVPKAQAFNEEEKTTIEGEGQQGWEEEASTTVEQGEVAARIQQIGNPRTNVTNTNGAALLDEPTVDDRGANPGAMTPAQLTVQARLVITAGNDHGQELTVAPGKSYTIGRALDNDLVLTDLAVSRKHFDLRYEGGAWVIADRGSGNGTLINGNIEDAPFVLANGDNIEIGNTQFRIDIPNTPPRGSNAAIQTMEASLLDEDMSTTAGVFTSEPPTTRAPERRPLTPRPGSVPPPNNPPRIHAGPTQPPLPLGPPPNTTMPPGATMPMRPHALGGVGSPGAAMRSAGNGRVPGVAGGPIGPIGTGPMASPMGTPMGSPISPGALAGNPMMLDGPIAKPLTTLPGTAAPIQAIMPSPLPPNPNGLDRASTSGALIIGANGTRDATSTALVQPTPYAMMPLTATPSSSGMSSKMKMIIAGVGGVIVLAIVIAIAASGGDDAPAEKPVADTPAETASETKLATTPVDEPKQTEEDADKQKAADEAEQKRIADDKAKADEIEAAKVAEDAEKQRLADEAKAAKAAEDAEKKRIADEAKAAKAAEDQEKKRIADETKAAKRAEEAEKKKAADAERKRIAEEKKRADAEKKAQAKKDPPETKAQPKTVAFDASGAKKKADDQYRAKDFLDAGKTLSAAASASSGDDARDLKQLASIYTQLGKAYNVGTAPATKATEAWDRLSTALKLDGSVGKAHSSELRSKLAALAPKAAAGFMSAKEFTKARSVVVFAEANGAGSSTITAVKSGLEQEASKLYKAAQDERDADAAKQKYRQIQAMVDSKSSWYQKAAKALASR